MILGVDVSHWQDQLPWAEWVAGGLAVACVQTYHGDHPEPRAAQHLAGALAARVPHIGAYHWLYPGHGSTQAAAFLKTLQHAHTFVMLDVEEDGVTGPDVLAWVGYYSANCALPLYLYGNNQLAAIIAANPQLARYGVWWAAYPTFPNEITTPPAGKPRTPPALRIVAWQYGGNNGRLPPYDGGIDLSVWYQLPSEVPVSIQLPMVPRGSLLGIHSIVPGQTLPVVKQAVADGLPIPAVVILNDGGVCVDIQAASPTTWRICRYYNPEDDALQDAVTWTPDQVQAWAQRQLAKILTNANDAQIAATHWFICHNEPDQNDPNARAYPAGWAAMARAWMACIEVTERENVTRRAQSRPLIYLGIGGLSQGTPEWEEMQAMFDVGLFHLMAKHGHLWVVHEGAWTDQGIDTGYGDTIPGAPATPNSGSACFRVEILYANLLRPAGIKLPLLIGEWYGGGRYTNPASDQVARMAWYDGLAANIPEMVGFCPFTSNPGPGGGWKDADYTSVYLSPELAAYRRSVATRINGANMPLTQADILGLREKFNSLAVQGSNVVAGANAGLAQLAALKPDDATAWWQTLRAPALQATAAPNKVLVFRHSDGTPITPNPRPHAVTYSLDIFSVNLALALLLVTGPDTGLGWWVAAADVSPA